MYKYLNLYVFPISRQMVKESKWATKYLQNNFCRNPTNATTAWCYTKDPSKRWEYCDIKLCKTGKDFTILSTVKLRISRDW